MTTTGRTSRTVVPTVATSTELRVARSPVPACSTTDTGRARVRETNSSRSRAMPRSPKRCPAYWAYRGRQYAVPTEVRAHGRGRRASLGDRPDDQRRAAVHVPGHERPGYGGLPVRSAVHAAARVPGQTELVQQRTLLGALEPDGQQDEVGGQLPFGTGDHGHLAPAVPLDDGHLGDPDRPDPLLPDELLDGDREDPFAALLVRRVLAQDPRPARPRVAALVAFARGQRVQVELGDAGRALPVRDAEAVRRGVPAADDDHVLARGVDRRAVLLAGHHAVGRDQVLHGQVYAREAPAGRVGHVPAGEGTGGQDHRVVPLAQLLDGEVDPDRAAGHEADALGAELGQPPVDVALLQLEVGDAVPQQPARLVVAFVHGHRVPGPGQLLRGGQPGRSGAHHGDRPAGRFRGRLRGHVPEVECPVDDLDLDLLDGHRLTTGDGEDARGLTRRRTQPPGELREVVGRVQLLDRELPLAGTHEVVPVRDPVAQRAAVVAERDAAVHAPARLRS